MSRVHREGLQVKGAGVRGFQRTSRTTKVRTDPKWATTLVRSLLVLTNRGIAR